ncbi:hypothetical protein FOMPIDRAFT_1029487 [Fomitopsis schrenkii]|uniref:Carboxylic ester hydrolase n=1 Tax=Fomitopsis schrenkii TaxID=2126942 RepID=S8FLH7_FOMSC|nr:hypothetical protein FOMPIDRAFT_1029487 [Fomitopsis schrenkii]
MVFLSALMLGCLAAPASVLLLSPFSNSEAAFTCAELGETLLPVNETFFETELVPSLQYDVYQGHYGEGQLYWVQSSGNTCEAVNTQGFVVPAACDLVLPTLCSRVHKLALLPNRRTLSLFVRTTSPSQGIPYADPPARFTYPTPWTGSKTLNATAFGSECVHAGVRNGSEDCLLLNIWTPYNPEDPDTVSDDTGSDPTFAGGNMASRRDVVVVTINYRLSTPGFLALEDGVTNGNFGLAGQVAALDWAREYITAFGGGPNRITIFGQSAGAGSVRALLGSPQAIGKFAAEVTTPVVDPILEETGCNATDAAAALACLKAYGAYELVSLTNVARFIVVDGTYVTRAGLIANGTAGPVAHWHVHTMISMGYMRDDGAAFIGYPNTTNLTAALVAQDLPPGVVDDPLFPLPIGTNATYAVFNFRCLDQATAYYALQHDLFQSAWFYESNRSYQTPGFDPNYSVCDAPVSEEYPYGDPSQEYFKCHSGELFYVFGSLPDTLPYRDDLDLPFMQRTIDVWTSFARTYNPNADPKYLAVRRTLQWTSFMGPFAEQAQCDHLGYPLAYYEY